MNVVNWLLIHGAEALLWSWELVKTVFGAVGWMLDVLLNPILSPLLRFLNPICTVVADAIYGVLGPLPVWFGLTLVSVIAGFLMLLAFRYLSNQAAIGRVKDDIRANLLALKLYKDELRTTFRAQLRILWALARLQRYILVPILALALPMLLGLAQMGIRYQWRPLRPGEQTLIKMELSGAHANPTLVDLQPSPGAILEAGPVPGGGLLVWRVRAGEPGRYLLHFDVAGTEVVKEFVVGEPFQRISAERPGARWTAQLLHPVETPLAGDLPIKSVQVLYPGADSWFCGSDYWLLTFFVISMAAALILKPVFRVRF